MQRREGAPAFYTEARRLLFREFAKVRGGAGRAVIDRADGFRCRAVIGRLAEWLRVWMSQIFSILIIRKWIIISLSNVIILPILPTFHGYAVVVRQNGGSAKVRRHSAFSVQFPWRCQKSCV